MKTRLTPSQLAAVYLVAFLFPIFTVGVLANIISFSQVMIPKIPPQVDPAKLPIAAVNRAAQPKPKFKAAIVLGADGTQVTDLLGPYEILARSGLFEVYTVASQKRLLATTAPVSVLPDYTFKDAPAPDLLVVPANLNPADPEVLDYVKKQNSRLTLGVCEGARVLAAAGLLKGKKATSHFMALRQLRQAYPETEWTNGPRLVEAGNILTSAGITGSLDAAFDAVAKFSDPSRAQDLALKMGYTWPNSTPRPEHFGLSDGGRLALRGGFGWSKPTLAVFVYPGESELGLAAIFDTALRAQSYTVIGVTTLGASLIETEHGLKLFARDALSDANEASILVVPPGANFTQGAELKSWAQSHHAEFVDQREIPSGTAFSQDLDLLREHQGAALTRIVAKLIEYPGPVSEATNFPPAQLLVRMFLTGLLGVVLVHLIRRRFMAA